MGMISKLSELMGGLKSHEAESPAPDLSRVLKSRAQSPPKEDIPETSAPNELEIEDRAEAALERRQDEFNVWVERDIRILQENWQKAVADELTPDAVESVEKAAGDLYGIAESCGFPTVSRLSGSLSLLFAATRFSPDQELVRLHIEACRAAFLYRLEHGESDPSTEAVCQALELRVRQQISAT